EIHLVARTHVQAGAEWQPVPLRCKMRLGIRIEKLLAWPSDRTLSLLEGSCRDLAVLFCDVCRVMGIATRFVSGYECASASSQDSYMHAWAEVYLPGIGWRGYDPS